MREIANTYAEALYALAVEDGKEEAILRELSILQEGISAEPDFLRLLANPALPRQERCRILDDSFRGKVAPYVLNFLKILTERGYMRCFFQCCDAYRDRYNRECSILPVTATTALPLTDEQKQQLTGKLAALTGKTIALRSRVDPAVLGGVRLDYAGIQLDDTIRHRLDTVGNLLKNTVL